MRASRLKIPPPVVFLLIALLMGLVAWATPDLDFDLPARRGLAAALAIAGVSVAVAGIVSFRRAGTTVNPFRPEKASALVVCGIYRYTRNPMYLGLLMALMGWAVFLSNALAFVVVPMFILYMNRFQIAPEESALTSLFGPEFVAYKARVRRWL